ncbi:MAG: glycosyltransferase [Thermoleophilaceae bacterium]|nr:glycosyltransferase [Thermoleophilaceae bacterium]
MDFVTITDHDTIAGALEIADRPDVFISEELTVWFRNEAQAVHVLCYGITPDDHEWLQVHNGDVEACAAYLREHDVTCALAHPFYAVEAPLTPRHRRRLAELFPVWETRNGSRARELNMPAAIYIETHGGVGVAGSDDHAGVDIGRTFTRTPHATTPEDFLRHVREGRADALGSQGSAAKWAHSAIALALRAHGLAEVGPPDPRAVLTIIERVMGEGEVRAGEASTDLGPGDARALLAAWLGSIELEGGPEGLIELMQSENFSHRELFRRVRRIHERRMVEAVDFIVDTAAPAGSLELAAGALFHAITPAIPYVPATAFLGRETGKLHRRDDEPQRVALVVDGIGSMHGVTRTIDEIRSCGVPGFEVEVVGTDPNVDRRLSSVRDVEIPFYKGLRVGVPSITALTEALADGRYDLVHLCSPGPLGIGAAAVARIMRIPTLGSYHTELADYAGVRSGERRIADVMERALSLFYGSCDHVLSPSAASDASLHALGIPRARIGRWERGVDVARFDCAKRDATLLPDRFKVLYAGRLTKEKGVGLLAEAFLEAHALDPRFHLLLAGGGPEEQILRERLGENGTYLGWLEGDALAQAYASADAFLFASQTDTFGQVVLEAQASGLPVVAVAAGGPVGLIDHRVTGLLSEPTPGALSSCLLTLAMAPELRARIAESARTAVLARTWSAALAQLADGYERALGDLVGMKALKVA